jgi:hypothetical protein
MKAPKSSLAVDCFTDFEVGCELLLLASSTPQPVQTVRDSIGVLRDH